jgi:hypothetical protein
MENSEGFYLVEREIESEIDCRYHRLFHAAKVGRWLGTLTGHSRSLRSVAQAIRGYHIVGQHHQGLQAVPVERIVGSEGRSEDFDGEFRPLNNHTQKRWYSIARARLNGVTLPAVALIRIGDAYYVRDGNHRVSVARALGDAAIDAEVTAYHLAPQTVANQAPAAGQEAWATA